MNPPKVVLIVVTVAAAIAAAAPSIAEVDNQQGVLQSLFPAGGSRGNSVTVTFTGNKGGLQGADGLVIDGAPGITVVKFESLSDSQVRATLAIAEDAAPGRRMVRVKGGVTGLTNFRWFFVSTLKEHVESSRNNELKQAESIEMPVVVNGRIEKTLDQDCFRFAATRGQSLVLAVQSHWLDAMGYDRNTAGFADASLELLDSTGRVVAEAGDTLGYDPLLQYTVPSDGSFTARISGMGYKGFPQFVYRLTIGDMPYPTSIFPSGGTRGETVEVTFNGPNVPPGTTQTVIIGDDPAPVQYVRLDGAAPGLAFVRSDRSELTPPDPGNTLQDALPIDGRSLVVNGAFERQDDADWFRLELAKGEKIALDVLAQRHLRSPVDTRLEVFDAKGKLLATNDDGQLILSEVNHEFVPFDSQLSFKAKKAGPHFVRLSEQSGAGGSRAVYRLTVTADEPDFELFQWPDAAPVWGPGTTAGFVVEIHRFGGLKEDVELAVEGLPEGWTGSVTTAHAADYRHAFRGAFGHKLFLTITAPADVVVGTMAEFRVIGRSRVGDKELTRTAQPLTQLAWGEPNRFRAGIKARVVVARPQGLPLESGLTEVSTKANAAVEIPLLLPAAVATPSQPVSLSVNRAGTHFKCSVGAPIKVKFQDGKGLLKFSIPAAWKAGREFEVLVSNAWSSETRKGLPGPCTRLIHVRVVE